MFIVGESGKNFYASMGIDMSTNTELSIVFIKPDGTTVTKTQTASEVALGASGLSFDDPDGSPITVLANQYLVYNIETGFLDQAGNRTDDTAWKAYGIYTNTGTTPTTNIIGLCVEFDVSEICPDD